MDTNIKGVPFNAMSASEDSKAVELVTQSGADGFSFDSKPLFQVIQSVLVNILAQTEVNILVQTEVL